MFRGFTFRRLTLLLGCDLVDVCDLCMRGFRAKTMSCENKAQSIFVRLTLDCPNVCMFVLFLHVFLGTTSESHLGWFRVKSVRFSGFP